jgi:hypothetical protein
MPVVRLALRRAPASPAGSQVEQAQSQGNAKDLSVTWMHSSPHWRVIGMISILLLVPQPPPWWG